MYIMVVVSQFQVFYFIIAQLSDRIPKVRLLEYGTGNRHLCLYLAEAEQTFVHTFEKENNQAYRSHISLKLTT